MRRLLVPVTVALLSVVVAIALLEVALRNFPFLWPEGVYGGGRISPDLQLKVHDRPVVYNHVRWNLTVPNHDGFLDVEHVQPKPAGVTRVGFFGDSFVEAVQVARDDTFFRRLPDEIAGNRIEPLAFGISGWGTLHSLLTYRVMGRRYQLDYVVYFFVPNDPGDNDYAVRRSEPAADLADNESGFLVHMAPEPPHESVSAAARRFVDENLLLAQITRVQLATRQAAGNLSQAGRQLDQNDLPSTWPPATLAESKELTRRILRQFRDEVIQDGGQFAVLYVPAGDRDLEGTLPAADSWLPWLSQTCTELNIDLLDPRGPLSKAHDAGEVIYDDHWSPAGHRLIASFVEEYLGRKITAKTARSIGDR